MLSLPWLPQERSSGMFIGPDRPRPGIPGFPRVPFFRTFFSSLGRPPKTLPNDTQNRRNELPNPLESSFQRLFNENEKLMKTIVFIVVLAYCPLRFSSHGLPNVFIKTTFRTLFHLTPFFFDFGSRKEAKRRTPESRF